MTVEATLEMYASTSPAAVQQAVSRALDIAKDNSHGYSQQTRWGNPNYDCSSFVITCWDFAGNGCEISVCKYSGHWEGVLRYIGDENGSI